MKKLRVTIEGKSYDVLVEVLEDAATAAPLPASPLPTAPSLNSEPLRPAATAALAPQPLTAVAGLGPGDVPCPLSGKVVSIDVKMGDTVQEGAQVATVEAMKMNTYIYAPRAGRVTAILVNPGNGVEEGAVLLRIS